MSLFKERLPFAGFLSFLVVLAIWELIVQYGFVNRVLLPAPSTIGPVLLRTLETGAFFKPLSSTLSLLALGYGAGCLCGAMLGLMMGCFQPVYALCEPLIELLRPIPKSALVPPMFLFFGIGDTTIVILIALACFFPVLLNTVQGVRGVDVVLLDTARTFRTSQRRVIFQIILRAAFPMILAGMRVSLGLGLIIAVLSEMLAGNGGLGLLIVDMQRSFRTTEMYVWVAILAAVGVFLTFVFDRIEAWAIPWRSY